MNNKQLSEQIEPFLSYGENRGCYLVALPNGGFGPWFVALRQALDNTKKEKVWIILYYNGDQISRLMDEKVVAVLTHDENDRYYDREGNKILLE